MTPAPEDFVEIHQLYARQSQAIDLGDASGWAATFTEDGTFESPTYGRTVRGRAELTDFARRFAEAAAAEGRGQRHWTNSIVLETRDDGGVSATGYLAIVTIDPPQPPRIDRHVEISDRFERTATGWRVRSRVVAPSDQEHNPKER